GGVQRAADGGAPRAAVRRAPGGGRMRPRAAVFAFHDVVPASRLADVPPAHRPYALDPREFRAHLLAAADSPRRAVAVSRVPGELGGGFFSLTFDDGAASDYEYAFPVLVELGLRATFFVVPTRIDRPGQVTWAQLREMLAAGMEIGSHSMTHPFLDALDEQALRREFGDSKRLLEDRLGAPVHAASRPRGPRAGGALRARLRLDPAAPRYLRRRRAPAPSAGGSGRARDRPLRRSPGRPGALWRGGGRGRRRRPRVGRSRPAPRAARRGRMAARRPARHGDAGRLGARRDPRRRRPARGSDAGGGLGADAAA